MNDDKIIRDAQYRKGLSIAFFNATNAAVELTKQFGNADRSIREQLVDWRDWLLDEHKKYYAQVIANIGQVYSVQDTLAKLRSAGSLDELRTIWVGLSEDERRDGEVIGEVNKLKTQYATG